MNSEYFDFYIHYIAKNVNKMFYNLRDKQGDMTCPSHFHSLCYSYELILIVTQTGFSGPV